MAQPKNKPLKILFLTAEYDPFAKVGGLGDYSGSLPKAIKGLAGGSQDEIDIRVAIPYHGLFNAELPGYRKIADLSVRTAESTAHGQAFQFTHHLDMPVYLIKRSGNARGYGAIYNADPLDDARKYVFFSLAIADLIRSLGWMPDVVHANDWHTALTIYHLACLRRKDLGFSPVSLLQVIHNLPYLGEGTQAVMEEFGIQALQSRSLPKWAEYLPLTMGLASADWITTVSPSYAEEITTEEFADGLADFFIQNQDITSGILNGIDTSIWNPEIDPVITSRFSFENLEDRYENKLVLTKDLGFESSTHTPLIVFVSRLTPQKGISLILSSLPELLDLNWNAVFLGTGMLEYESALTALEMAHPGRFRAVLRFDNLMAHRLYASGDILLMPSLYEPCGLSQMIGMRYGCIPLARGVGGLKDSIISVPAPESTGYLFQGDEPSAFTDCFKKALQDFKDRPEWEARQRRAMQTDFTWDRSARRYVDLYRGLRDSRTQSIN